MKQTFTCEFCGPMMGVFDNPDACMAHEASCNANPAARTCATCKHYGWPKTPDQDRDWEKWDDSEECYVTAMGCHVFNDMTFRRQCVKWEGKAK